MNSKPFEENLTSSPEVEPDFFSKYHISEKAIFLPLMICLVVDMLGYSLTLPLVPSIVKGFGGGDFLVGIITSANAITSFIFGPIWGRMSDKYGRKKILFISQIGTFLSFLLLATSNSVNMILFARLLDGLFGGQYTVIHAIVSDITKPENRAEKLSHIMVTVGISSVIGPLLGGILGAINWRLPPLITAGFSLLSIVLTSKILIETMPKSRRDNLAAMKKNSSKNATKSILNSSSVKSRLFQSFLVSGVFTMFTSSMALILDARYQQGVSSIGIIMTLMFVFLMIFGTGLMKPLRKKIGDYRLCLSAIGSGLVSWIIFIYSETLGIFILFLFFLIFFYAMIRPLLVTNLTKAVDASHQGEVSGWSSSIQSIAQSIIPLISTGFLELKYLQIMDIRFISYTLIGICSIGFLMLLGIILMMDARKNPELFKKLEEN
jgi:DHA1 family tetracycline resistance protein-like MFS transporter